MGDETCRLSVTNSTENELPLCIVSILIGNVKGLLGSRIKGLLVIPWMVVCSCIKMLECSMMSLTCDWSVCLVNDSLNVEHSARAVILSLQLNCAD